MTARRSDSQWQVESGPITALRTWAENGGRLFASEGWAEVLAQLDAQPLFAWNASRGIGTVVPVFRRFGIKVGFLGFPVAGPDFDVLAGNDHHALTRDVAGIGRLALVRTTQSQQAAFDARAVAGRPEAWIDELTQWDFQGRKRLRKDLAFARRACAGSELVSEGFVARDCFELYAAAVQRHQGTHRYGLRYFEALQDLARKSRLLKMVAMRCGQKVTGFAVAALHSGVAHYLHGAVDSDGRRQGVSDLLLEHLIEFAKDAGSIRFTFMSSPWEQPGLMKFKRKWADSIGLSRTYDVPGNAVGRAVMLASSLRLRREWRHAATFVADRPNTREA